MADNVITALNEYGCDTQSALERFMNKEELYVRFLNKFLDDKSFAETGEQIAKQDYEAALQAVHTLKGVAGNLGFSPLYNLSADMVTKFRAGEPEEACAEYDQLGSIYKDVCEIIRANV